MSLCLPSRFSSFVHSLTRSLANPINTHRYEVLDEDCQRLRRELGAAYAANASLEKSLAALEGHRAEAAMTHAITTDASLFGLTDD